MLKQTLSKLMARQTLSYEEAYQAMTTILEGRATPSQISSLITLLTFRGIETEELLGLVKGMRDHATPLALQVEGPLVDTCGTGGAKFKTFNVSTASAITASASGLMIAKHGNRAASSITGSADVLEQLGLSIDVSPEQMEETLRRDKMCFMFAPMYHGAMKHAGPTRKELGYRTVFNLLGPLTNPAGAKRQVIGVFDPSYSLKMIAALEQLGAEHVLIVHSEDGLDELSIAAPTQVTELSNGQIKQYLLTPEQVGLERSSLEPIQVENAEQSAALIVDVFQGKNKQEAYDMICYNAGAALYVGGKVESLEAGVKLAQQLISSGQVYSHYLKMTERKGDNQVAQ